MNIFYDNELQIEFLLFLALAGNKRMLKPMIGQCGYYVSPNFYSTTVHKLVYSSQVCSCDLRGMLLKEAVD